MTQLTKEQEREINEGLARYDEWHEEDVVWIGFRGHFPFTSAHSAWSDLIPVFSKWRLGAHVNTDAKLKAWEEVSKSFFACITNNDTPGAAKVLYEGIRQKQN